MKKILLFAVATFTAMSMNAQTNLIQGGSMETADAAKWDTSKLVNADANTATFEFGYTAATPTAHEGGALHVTVTNAGADGAHIMFYQKVTLKAGKEYSFNFSVKTLQPMNNSWLEVYVGSKPVAGSDYSATNGKALGGFKWTGWEAGCAGTGDEFDGTLKEIGCLPGSQDNFSIDGEGDTTVYIGFKTGIWATAATIEFVFDNFSLTEVGGTSSVKTTNFQSMEASISDNILKVSNATAEKILIYNVTGQVVKSVAINSTDANINVSDLKPGLYIVKTDKDSRKVIK